MVTYFVVQSFQRGNKGMLIPDEPRQARDRAHCLAMCERMADDKASVVGFSRTGDADTGEWEDAVIISQFGDEPGDMLQVA